MLLTQGLSPHEIGLSVAFAVFWGVIPVFGVATPMITFLAIRYKLNVPIAIFVTYVLSPLHVGLFIPFIHAGEWLLGQEHLAITFEAIREGFSQDILETLADRGWQLSYGLLAWLVIMLPISIASYYLAKVIYKRYLA